MKQFLIAAVAALTLTATNAKAQDDDKQGGKPDRTEMIKSRTDKTVKEYGLDDTQAQKLLELNTKYAGKLAMPRGPRGGRRGGGDKGNPPQLTDEQKTQMETRRKEAEANREAYNKELQAIMTSDQYAKYTENMKKNRPQRPPKAE